jgi:hypothetical protein
MRDETLQLLEELRNLRLFRALGVSDGIGYQRVPSWSEALRECRKTKWENLRLMANNRSNERLHHLDWHRAQKWNPTCQTVRHETELIADAAIAEIAKTREVTEQFRQCVQWDLQAIVVEKEFADRVPPVLHLPRLYPAYQAGHFPCGWTGPNLGTYWAVSQKPIPNGDILVF